MRLRDMPGTYDPFIQAKSAQPKGRKYPQPDSIPLIHQTVAEA
jgi:hypothetical protein